MTDKQIDQSLKTGRLKLGFWHTLAHYSLVLYLAFLFAIIVYLISTDSIEVEHLPSIDIYGIWFYLIQIALIVLVYIKQRVRLRFRSVPSYISRARLVKVIEKAATKLNWEETHYLGRVMLVTTSISFFGKGERITILFDDQQVLVNSTGKRGSSRYGKDSRNVNTIIEAIEEANKQGLY